MLRSKARNTKWASSSLRLSGWSPNEDVSEPAMMKRDGDEDEIVFDSDDDDECEDIFAGTWDAEVVEGRRRRMVARRSQAENNE
jgi:hypothetical protein